MYTSIKKPTEKKSLLLLNKFNAEYLPTPQEKYIRYLKSTVLWINSAKSGHVSEECITSTLRFRAGSACHLFLADFLLGLLLDPEDGDNASL
jgi:hypothetical protein